VGEFLAELTERMHAQHSDLRAKIAGGDWSDETQKAVHDVLEAFAQDFGYDLDEEGQPLEDDEPLKARQPRDQPGEREEREEEPQPA
jgi:F-type H+/Na+-transporting ATPase subunit alpha